MTDLSPAAQHQITPPPELVEQWRATPEYTDLSEKLFLVTLTTKKLQDIATQAARWGADTELEACVEWVANNISAPEAAELRAAMRSKPPSLKELALAALRQVGNCEEIDNATFETIRRALEALPE